MTKRPLLAQSVKNWFTATERISITRQMTMDDRLLPEDIPSTFTIGHTGSVGGRHPLNATLDAVATSRTGVRRSGRQRFFHKKAADCRRLDTMVNAPLDAGPTAAPTPSGTVTLS